MVDQGASSLTNFGLSVAVARSVDSSTLGWFSIGYATYILSLGFARSMLVDPAIVVREAEHTDDRALRSGAAIALGLIVSALLVYVALLQGAEAWPLLPIGIAIPALLVQEQLRIQWFADSSGRRAALNDGLWLGMAVCVAIAVRMVVANVAVAALCGWAVGGMVAAVVGLLCDRQRIRFGGIRSIVASNGGLGPWFAAEFLVSTGSSQLATFAVAAVGGVQVSGALRAVAIAFSPLNMAQAAGRLVLLPRLARGFGTGVVDNRSRASLWVSIAIMLYVAGACALLGMYLWPTLGVGPLLLGASWDIARPLVVPAAIAAALAAVTAVLTVALRAMRVARQSLGMRTYLAPVRVSTVTGGAFVFGAYGAVWGQALGSALGAVSWLWLYRKKYHELGV